MSSIVPELDLSERREPHMVTVTVKSYDRSLRVRQPISAAAYAAAHVTVTVTVKRQCMSREDVLVAGGGDAAQAPWHFLYFLPLPHQQGSLRPSFSCGLAWIVCVAAGAATAAVLAPPASAASITSAPADV